MSFSSETKAELAHLPLKSKIEALLELSAFAWMNGHFTGPDTSCLSISSENPEVAQRIADLSAYLYPLKNHRNDQKNHLDRPEDHQGQQKDSRDREKDSQNREKNSQNQEKNLADRPKRQQGGQSGQQKDHQPDVVPDGGRESLNGPSIYHVFLRGAALDNFLNSAAFGLMQFTPKESGSAESNATPNSAKQPSLTQESSKPKGSTPTSSTKESSRPKGSTQTHSAQPDLGREVLTQVENAERVLSRLNSPANAKAYLRGSFLASGSVVNPDKSYHMEISCAEGEAALILSHVFSVLSIPIKTMERGKNKIFYLKDSEYIADFLVDIGAPRAMLQLENAKAMKDLRGKINRRVNAETANLSKMADAAARQRLDVETIDRWMGLDHLPDILREAAQMRLAHPEASLGDLGKFMHPPIGKSGVRHRMKRLEEIAEECREAERAEANQKTEDAEESYKRERDQED